MHVLDEYSKLVQEYKNGLVIDPPQGFLIIPKLGAYDWIAQHFHRLDFYRRIFIDYRFFSIFGSKGEFIHNR